MPKTLSSRDRLLTALEHREPDRVPISDFFWGGFMRRWREELGRPADAWLKETVRWTWRVKLQAHLTLDLLGQRNPRSLEICALLHKHLAPDLRREARFVGFDAPHEFRRIIRPCPTYGCPVIT